MAEGYGYGERVVPVKAKFTLATAGLATAAALTAFGFDALDGEFDLFDNLPEPIGEVPEGTAVLSFTGAALFTLISSLIFAGEWDTRKREREAQAQIQAARDEFQGF